MFYILMLLFVSSIPSFAQQILGDPLFTSNDISEWPKVVWHRDTPNNWDEGLIKASSSQSYWGRAGFGIHMHESRMFSFWSTNWTPLFGIQGGTGNVFIKGATGIGTINPQSKFQVRSDNSGMGGSIVNWIAGAFGGQAGQQVVIGNLYGVATIGAHNNEQNAWGNLSINTDGGNVGIGTSFPDSKLSVNGSIHAKEVKVDNNFPVPDYVFETNYPIASLKKVNAFITKNKHLPDVPSASEIKKNGMDLGEMNLRLLKKVEELTLYLIEKDKQLGQQHQELVSLRRQVKHISGLIIPKKMSKNK